MRSYFCGMLAVIWAGCSESPVPKEVDPGAVQSTQTETHATTMNWLITTERDVDLVLLDAVLQKHGLRRVEDRKIIPLDTDEQSIEITGSAFGAKELTLEAIVLGVYPSSNFTIDR